MDTALPSDPVARIGHELRTPATAIIAAIELMLDEDGVRSPEDVRRFLEMIERNAERLLAVTRDLRAGT